MAVWAGPTPLQGLSGSGPASESSSVRGRREEVRVLLGAGVGVATGHGRSLAGWLSWLGPVRDSDEVRESDRSMLRGRRHCHGGWREFQNPAVSLL